MKVALVHELLTMRGGAERMLRVIADMFPEAPIYTLLYDQKKLGEWFSPKRVRVSRVQGLAKFTSFFTGRMNHHLFLKRFPKAVEAWDFSEFDLVISSSSAFIHGIIALPPTKHLCYVHTPARYLWDQTWEVCGIRDPGSGIRDVSMKRGTYLRFGKMYQKMKVGLMQRMFHPLRQWDALTSERGDQLLAPSQAVQRRIELYWRRESTVLYPPVDISAFPLSTVPREDFYVIASQLVAYKRIELAIEACNQLGKKLIIAGEGPHRKKLERLSGSTIEFTGYVERSELLSLLQRARAFIFPGEEDFGIAPLEAMACGTPVIAYRGGGALETVREGQTGMFFNEPTVPSLMDAIKVFDGQSFDPVVCRAQAERFSVERFWKGMEEAVRSL